MPPSYAESGRKRGDEWPAIRVGTPLLTAVAGDLIVAREVAEAGELALERQLHRADRAVALLADDDLGLAATRPSSSAATR